MPFVWRFSPLELVFYPNRVTITSDTLPGVYSLDHYDSTGRGYFATPDDFVIYFTTIGVSGESDDDDWHDDDLDDDFTGFDDDAPGEPCVSEQ